MGKKPIATFFPGKDLAGKGQPVDPKIHGIDGKVAWAKKPQRGELQLPIQFDDIEVEIGMACNEWGICE